MVFSIRSIYQRQITECKGEGRPSIDRATKSKIKTMLIAFFDFRGIIHHEFVPLGQKVNAAFYKDVMDRLLQRIRRVRPKLYRTGDWFCTTMRQLIPRYLSHNF